MTDYKPISVEKPKLNNLLSDYNKKLIGNKTFENVKTEDIDIGTEMIEQVHDAEPVSVVKIPEDMKQAGYTVTGYSEEGWVMTDMSTMKVSDGTGQQAVHDKWVENGAHYKNGIAVMNVNGSDKYLVATTGTYGEVGDLIKVDFENGQSIECVIADEKNPVDANFTKYGHSYDGQTNILEFEVDIPTYNAKGNPTTESWGLDWDSNSKITQISNFGSVIKK